MCVDQNKAIEFYRRAADLDSSTAHFCVGITHIDGEIGLRLDEEEAIRHLRLAAKMGHVRARYRLGANDYI